MKVTIPFVWLMLAIGLVEASSRHAQRGVSAHGRLLRNRRTPIEAPLERRDAPKKRCKPKASVSTFSSILMLSY
jgi:hypothetical protein